MGPGDGVPGAAPRPRAPDPVLAAAAAMVFVDDPTAPVVGDADLRHLLDVLRLRPGELVVASDGGGRWVPCRVAPAAPARGSRGADPGSLLVPEGPVVAEARPEPEVTVAFAPTKGDRPEWVVQKLTELGVDRIVPLRTSRSVVRWEGDRGARSVERLRRVVRESASQCRRARLPEVTGVCLLGEVAGAAGGPVTLAEAGGGAPGLDRPVLAVGPEGGWDAAERDEFGPGVGLGATVLRAETAAVVAGALLCGLRSGVVLPLA
ncbi:MAG: RsmE family RNA methyltransferase [Acidimicrobiales bacterium]